MKRFESLLKQLDDFNFRMMIESFGTFDINNTQEEENTQPAMPPFDFLSIIRVTTVTEVDHHLESGSSAKEDDDNAVADAMESLS
ncbi:hypothetical protein V1477_005879 [Vespula maculifrons]|uniref:Uncharacterized protein n=1 Tax=Vespula maculifrons TaxID=7453 RepID=A0ABD2CLI7_VESMC